MRTAPPLQTSSAPSPARRWAARLALLVACVGSVATDTADPAAWFDKQGEPLTLRTDSPPVTRRFRIQVSTQKPSPRSLVLGVQANIAASWRPDSSDSPLRPRLSAWLDVTPGRPGYNGQESTDFQRAGDVQPDTFWIYPVHSSSEPCTLAAPTSTCVWHAALQFEVHPQGAVGTLPWSLHASLVYSSGGKVERPEDLTVEITEE